MGFFDWLFGKRSEQAQKQELNDELAQWCIAEIRGEGGVTVVARIRRRRPDLPDLARYSTAVSVSWPMDDDSFSFNGQPELVQAMNQFEDSLEELSEFSYLIQVRTGLGERSWLYYTSDADRLVTEIRSRMLGQGLTGLTIESKDDPEWAEWRLLAERIR